MKKSIKKMASLLAAATIVFSSVSAFATAPDGWTTSANFSKDYWEKVADWVNKSETQYEQIYDFGSYITAIDKARTNYDVSYVENDKGRSYLKLAPKADKEGAEGTVIGITNDLSGKFGRISGRSHLSFEFTLSDEGITNRMPKKNSTCLRLSDSPVSGKALVAGNGANKGEMMVGIGSYDGGDVNGVTATLPSGTWCRYYADIDYYTKKAVVGIKNADTEQDIIAPITVDITGESSPFRVQLCSSYYSSAIVSMGEFVYSKDTFVCDNASKKIEVTDSTVTASVKMANDVAKDLRAATYGVNGVNTSEPELILVQYDANGKYLAATSKPLTGMLSRDKSGNGERVLHEMSVTMDKAEGYSYAKAFLWDSFSGLEPFTTAWTNK